MKPPIPNSYWVEPGRVLAGEHPDGGGETATRARLQALLGAGVRGFIDLTESHELPDYRGLLPAGVAYHSFPLPDHSVPRDVQQMREVQNALERLMAAGTIVYVHCRAGIGRTGITIGCYLREQGESAEGALSKLNRLWQQNARAARWPSIPETPEQEQFILDWDPHPLDAPALRDSGLHRLQSRPLERYRGCLMGLAIADVSATAPATRPSGWSEHTAMVVCAAESLLATGRFDGRDQLERIRDWVHDPALQDASPLLRSAAAALFIATGPGSAGALGADLARITHQAPLPVDAARLLADMIAAALRGQPRDTILQLALRYPGLPLRDELRLLAQDWNGPRLGRRRPPTGILGALDRAVRCFSRSRDFPDGLERALVSPGPEKSAVAACYGALAGAWYGEPALPSELQSRVAGLARLGDLAARLFQNPGAAGGKLA